MGILIYAFPGTGKTMFTEKNKNSIELKSEKYHWLDYVEGEDKKGVFNKLNKNWPQNYLNAIKTALNEYKYVFITHSGSLLCEQENIPYILIYPSAKLKKIYIENYKKRKNNDLFIKNLEENFEKYILDCHENTYASKKIILKKDQYISNIINAIDEKFIVNVNETGNNKYMLATKKYCYDNNIKTALLVFNNSIKEYLKENNYEFDVIGRFYSSMDYHELIYYNNCLIVQPFLGGPNASGLIEELNYYGIKNIIAIGTALNVKNNRNSLMLVDYAYIGEGTSRYYNYNLDRIKMSNILNTKIKKFLTKNNYPYFTADIFTTDAYYRESKSLIEYLRSINVCAIDMECSAFATVCKNKNINFSQIIFFKDGIDDNVWNKYFKNIDIKDKLLELGIKIINHFQLEVE